ncbi:MAG: MFS transporter [Clostridium sp.]|uniref:MFS transporter n=1 Tax=Clostridium sp. TaxID=1506 RepID=UPI003D6C7868
MKFKILKQKSFSLLMIGKLVSLIGSEMQGFALSLYVLKITGSAAKFASVLAITIIPKLILGPIAGVLVDWFDRKKIIVYLDMLTGILIGIYAMLFMINGSLSMGSIYVLSILLSFISLLFQPAISTIIPSIIKKEDLIDANGINSLIMSVGSLIAPAVAGVLFGIYGMLVILIINSISFILSSISEMFIHVPKSNKKPEKVNVHVFFNDFSEGIRFIKSKKIMVTIISFACILNFAFAPIGSIGLAFISKKILKVTDYQYGALEGILVTSMIIAPFIMSKVSKKFTIGKIFFLDIFITSILSAIMAVIPSSFYLNLFNSNLIPYISLIIITFMIGLIISIGNIALSTMFQQEVPLEIMGRVGTVMSSLSMAAMPLGLMLFGFLFDKIDAWICVAITSLIFFLVGIISKKILCGDDKTTGMENLSEKSNNADKEFSISNEELACAVNDDEN